MGQPPSDPMQRGHGAMARCAWHEASEAFEGALETDRRAEALEGLGGRTTGSTIFAGR